MTPERHPWFKFHASDWRGDTKLRGCSLAARGLWADCMAIMHEATPRGYLNLTPKQLALMVGRPTKEVAAALAELERHGVSSRNEDGWLYSRRMVRDTARSITLTENGKRGGNPAILVNQTLNQNGESLVKPLVKSARVTRVLTSSLSVPELEQARTEKPKPQNSLVLDRFDTFWDAYPRKTNRKGAQRAFVALNPSVELFTQMLDAIATWRVAKQWRDGFVPHAVTWLHQERWTDEVPPEPAPIAPLTMTKEQRIAATNAASLQAVLASYRDEELIS